MHCLAMYIVGESVLNSAVYESILGSKHFEAFDPQKFRAEQLRSKPRKLYLGSRRPLVTGHSSDDGRVDLASPFRCLWAEYRELSQLDLRYTKESTEQTQ